MRRVSLPTTVVLGALMVLLAACEPGEPEIAVADQVAAEDRAALEQAEGGGEAEGDNMTLDVDGETVTYVGTDNLEFTAAPGEIPAGTTNVELECGALEHNVIYEGVNNDEPVVECPGGGEGGTGQQTLETGEYTYYCDVAGHREAGMEGTVLVVEG